MSQSIARLHESPLSHMLSIVRGEIVPTNCGPYNSLVVNHFAGDRIGVPPKMRQSFEQIHGILQSGPHTTKQIADEMGRRDTTYVHRLLLNMESIGMIVGARSTPRVWSTVVLQ